MIKQLIFTGITLLFLSCNKTADATKISPKKDSIQPVSKIHTPSTYLTDNARKELANWKHFDEFEKIMEQFYLSSPSEVKLNAKDLSDIVNKIKDSIAIEKINRPDVKARFNILHNEAVRLVDMSTISSITNEEVNQKIENIIYAYESIIAKINQVFLMNINEENVDVQFQAPKVLDTIAKEVKKQEKDLKLIKKQY